MIELEKIKSQKRLWKIRKDWETLLENSEGNDLFLHPDWILPWLKVFGKEYDLFFIALWEDAHLAGLFPLCRKRFGPFYVLTFAGSPVSDRMDFVLMKGREEAYLESFAGWLMSERGWDKVILDNFGTFSVNPEMLKNLMEEAGAKCQLTSAGRYYYVPVERYESLDKYMKLNKTFVEDKHDNNLHHTYHKQITAYL